MSETPGERLRQVRRRKYESAAAAAEALGIKAPTYQAHENGTRGITVGVAHKYARAFGVSSSWLLYGTDPLAKPKDGIVVEARRTDAGKIVEIEGDEFVAIPRYDARLSAGHGAIVDPNAEPLGFHLVEQQWLRTVTNAAPAALATVRVDGDSMEDTLRDGDWVLVDRTQRRLNREGIYALAVGDACWVKRITLNLREQMIRVISDNPSYPVQELTEDELTPIGRVVLVVARRL